MGESAVEVAGECDRNRRCCVCAVLGDDAGEPGGRGTDRGAAALNRPNVCESKVVAPDDLASVLSGTITAKTVPGDPQTCEFSADGYSSVSVTVRPGLGDVTVSEWTGGKMPADAGTINGVGDRAAWQRTLHELIATKHNVLCDIGSPGHEGQRGGSAEEVRSAVRQDLGGAMTTPHHYPLAVRNSGFAASLGLLMRSLPYALMRFAVLLAFSMACIVWMVITIGGSAWMGTHIAGAFGVVWFLSCIVAAGWFWTAILRYVLHLIECGHVAVLTELIVHGRVGNDAESMFAYGKRVVTEKFGQVNVLFAINLLVRGVVNAVHRTMEGVGHMLPIPGIESIANLMTAILRAATRYMDKVIFSYNLASGDDNPWRSAQHGLIYYAQNASPILKQSVWIVVLEYVLSALLWLVCLIPAAALTAILPHSVREIGAVVTIVVAGTVRPCGSRRVSQARVSHHDHGAVPCADRARADQRRVGGAAGRALRQVPRSGEERRDICDGTVLPVAGCEAGGASRMTAGSACDQPFQRGVQMTIDRRTFRGLRS